MTNLNTWSFCGRVMSVDTKPVGKGTLSKVTLRQYSDGKEPKPVFCQFDSWHTPPPKEGQIITAWGHNEDSEWKDKRYPCRKCDGWVLGADESNPVPAAKDNAQRPGTGAKEASGTGSGVASAGDSNSDDIPF